MSSAELTDRVLGNHSQTKVTELPASEAVRMSLYGWQVCLSCPRCCTFCRRLCNLESWSCRGGKNVAKELRDLDDSARLQLLSEENDFCNVERS